MAEDDTLDQEQKKYDDDHSNLLEDSSLSDLQWKQSDDIP